MMLLFQFLPRKFTCLLLFSFVLAGCSTVPYFKAYKGEKEIDELAVLKGETKGEKGFFVSTREHTYISYVSNMPTHKFFDPVPENILVEPGRHYLQVNYRGPKGEAFSKVWLDAERGKTYIVKAKEKGGRAFFWIEDEETGKPVGGIPGGEPENQKEN